MRISRINRTQNRVNGFLVSDYLVLAFQVQPDAVTDVIAEHG